MTRSLEVSGSALDQRIGRLVEGRSTNGEVPSYSTDDRAADAVLSRLATQGLASTFEQDEDKWYCVLWVDGNGDRAKERLATGSAPTRPLAICRAVLNLPLRAKGRSLRLGRSPRGFIADLSEARSKSGAGETPEPVSDFGRNSARAR